MNDIVTQDRVGHGVMQQLGNDMPMFRLYLDPTVRNAIRELAKEMAEDTVFTPAHLRGKPAACATVITKAIAWNMHPDDVADGTYQPTPGGPIAFKSKVINAAISAHFEGGIHFKHYGDWSKVQNKFKTETSQNGKKYQVPTWTEKDAEGCGVEVSGRLRGERESRRLELELSQCWPRFSTLWATDPKTQICYTALRRFTSVSAPAAMMSLRLPGGDGEVSELDMGDADVVQQEPIIMPRARETVDTSTGEVKREAPEEQKPEQQEARASSGTLTDAALRILRPKLQDAALMQSFLEHFKIDAPDKLDMQRVNDAFAWIAEQGGAK